MQGDSRNSTFARIGRSYPRGAANSDANATARSSAGFGRYRIAGALIAVLSALGLIGWLLR